MDPDDLLAIKLVSLAAAVIVNAGTGAPPSGVLAQAAEYEAAFTPVLAELNLDGAPPA